MMLPTYAICKTTIRYHRDHAGEITDGYRDDTYLNRKGQFVGEDFIEKEDLMTSEAASDILIRLKATNTSQDISYEMALFSEED